MPWMDCVILCALRMVKILSALVWSLVDLTWFSSMSLCVHLSVSMCLTCMAPDPVEKQG